MQLINLSKSMIEVVIDGVLGGRPIRILFSYNTPVAVCDSTGICFQTSKKWSKTTSKHIEKWLAGKPAHKETQVFFDAIVRGIGKYENMTRYIEKED